MQRLGREPETVRRHDDDVERMLGRAAIERAAGRDILRMKTPKLAPREIERRGRRLMRTPDATTDSEVYRIGWRGDYETPITPTRMHVEYDEYGVPVRMVAGDDEGVVYR